MQLEEYKKKRDFHKTTEPKGELETVGGNRFVVQEHNAERAGHHYDFRLEMGGVLKSWAVPKGVPLEKGKKVLAIETEDHPVAYIDFSGRIPEGSYGAGEVKIYDKGKYKLKENKADEIIFELEGKKIRGTYILVRFKKAGTKTWLLFKT